jgi:hypothetical protein
MTGRAQRRTSRVLVGGALLVIGGVWIGQGLGYIPGSFMTGDPFWAVAGVVFGLGGAAILALELRRAA